MANHATLYKRALAPLLLALCTAGLNAADTPVKDIHACPVHCPKHSGPTEKYVVQDKDVLYCIANQSGTTAEQLAGVNHLGSKEMILAGQTLDVPAGKKIVSCAKRGHKHPSTAGVQKMKVRKRHIVVAPTPVPREVSALDWASLLRLRISVEVEGNNAPHIQVNPIMFVPMTEDMKKGDSTVAGEWKTIRVGNDEYRVRVTIPEVSPTAPVAPKEAPTKEASKLKEVEIKLNPGPDVKTFVASEKK